MYYATNVALSIIFVVTVRLLLQKKCPNDLFLGENNVGRFSLLYNSQAFVFTLHADVINAENFIAV